jgi:sugar O-acyltransferase (sialic acid O-acetyltransferase NeuD family)
MADVVLFGLGQIAEIAKAYLDWEGTHRVVAFTADKQFLQEEKKDGLQVVAWEELNQLYPPGQVSLFCPISFRGVNKLRKQKFIEGKDRGYEFITFIHPKAYYYGTPVGSNCFVMEANVIQPFVQIGDNCILWSGNHIGHHSRIQDHTFIASHVVVSGSVDVGERCFIGVNATIRDNVKIGAESVIGAGALISSDLPDFSVVQAPKSEVSKVKSFQLRKI